MGWCSTPIREIAASELPMAMKFRSYDYFRGGCVLRWAIGNELNWRKVGVNISQLSISVSGNCAEDKTDLTMRKCISTHSIVLSIFSKCCTFCLFRLFSLTNQKLVNCIFLEVYFGHYRLFL